VRLNLGCGDNKLRGWENHDADIDITKPLPWPNDSADFVFIEHCIEHVGYYQAIEFFKECRRILKFGGVLRVIVPSITQILCCDDQEYFDWLKAKGWAPTADTRGAMHAILYCHGHQQAWTATLMEATLYYCGFDAPKKCDPYVSSHPPLCNVDGHYKVIGDKFNRIESLVFEAAKAGVIQPVVTRQDLAKDYDRSFFQMHVPWQEEYVNIAEALEQNMVFGSALDLGCGNGYIIAHLERHRGKTVKGIDGSSNVLRYSPRIEIADLTRPMEVGRHDLVICTEVAEHIEERYADTLIDTICRSSREWVFFSAAKAGHGGHLHVNEQERPYWIDKFRRRGFVIDVERTSAIADELSSKNKKTWWFAANSFVLRRGPRAAIVVGGAECVWDDVARACELCAEAGVAPEFFVVNDMIPEFPGHITACTLHPDKLASWLVQRGNAKLPIPSQCWSHTNGGSHSSVTNRLKDWGGSSGLFAFQVAREHGHDKVLFCGVPMTVTDKHFVRKANWSACSAFTRQWENHKGDIVPYARSMSGWTATLLGGVPTAEWLTAKHRELADA
jgi:ubiquinone/menaquinone biosynthesis C-methylase UbiE